LDAPKDQGSTGKAADHVRGITCTDSGAAQVLGRTGVFS
jgi:hypothetical protein